MKDKSKERLYFISLNLVKERHKDLIEWIKKSASKEERSLSSFCILILKKYMEGQDEDRKG
jgi:hypothetical protein